MTISANNKATACPTASAKRTSRWVLYHGTSTIRLKDILKENRLRVAGTHPRLSLTTDECVAEYFACNTVFGHQHFPPHQDAEGVVLLLDGEKLLEEHYPLFYPEDYTDLEAAAKRWDPENWHLENELFLERDVAPFSEFLIDTIAVKQSTYETYRTEGRRAFMPRVPFAASVERHVMNSLFRSGVPASTVLFALKGIRGALTHLRQSKRPSRKKTASGV